MLVNSTIEKAYLKGANNKEELMKAARYIGNKYCKAPDGNTLTQEALNNIVEVTAIDMATGAAIKKNEHAIQGALIGVVVTLMVITVNKFRNKGKA